MIRSERVRILAIHTRFTLCVSSAIIAEIREAMNFMDYQLHRVKDLQIKKKSKKGIMHLVFGRTGILLGCLLLQILLLFVGLRALAEYVYVFFGGYLAFGFVILLIILNRTDNPTFQLAWASLVLLFPVFGGLLYLYVEIQPGTAMLRGRFMEVEKATRDYTSQDPGVLEELKSRDTRAAQLAHYVGNNGYPIYKNTKVTYFPSGEAKFEELLRQLSKAERFIFLEYFIVSEGFMLDCVLKILKEKVKEGVEVRFMYDGMNELTNIPHSFPDELKGAGIRCKIFSPVYPVISTHYNNRDHRKIVVIDGRTAFTGGVNLADEYINCKERFGHWKDAAVMLQGDAAQSFTAMFLRMWAMSEKVENLALYVRPTAKSGEESEGFVMPYGENPFSEERIAERIYVEILNSASRYVHIMTPYLVPDHEMLQALIYAAERGIDVKLILPHIPDKKYAFALAHSYYRRLMRAGVRIYEYTPGFVHSKVFVSDDARAVVGAINLDFRSLYLHFECAAFLYQVPEIQAVEDDFRATLPKCQLITPFDVRHDKWTRKAAGKLLKVVAPLM